MQICEGGLHPATKPNFGPRGWRFQVPRKRYKNRRSAACTAPLAGGMVTVAALLLSCELTGNDVLYGKSFNRGVANVDEITPACRIAKTPKPVSSSDQAAKWRSAKPRIPDAH
jgi:hypothetical protein